MSADPRYAGVTSASGHQSRCPRMAVSIIENGAASQTAFRRQSFHSFNTQDAHGTAAEALRRSQTDDPGCS